MSLFTNTEIDELQKVKNADDKSVPVANDDTYSAVDNVAIDATGAVLTLDTHGKDTLEVAVEAPDGTSAQFGIEASPDGQTWFGPTVTSASGISEWYETLDNGARVVRLTVVSSASGGTTADVYLEAS